MNVLILFFSGTGNTEYVSRYIHEKLQISSNNISIDRYSLESFNPTNIVNYDLIYFGFPIYALDAPSNVRAFVNELPDLSKKGIIFFCTMGIVAGNAFERLYSLFKPLNITHLGSFAVKMPGTDGLAMLTEKSGYVRNALKRDYSHFSEFDVHFDNFSSLIQTFQSKNSFTSLAVPPPKYLLDTLLGWSFRGLYHVMENFIKKRFWVDDNCTHCNSCISQCPMNNIKMDEEKNRITFGTDCVVCLRCIHQCPVVAIQISRFTQGKFRWRGPKGDFQPIIPKK